MSSQGKLLSDGYFQRKNDRTCFRWAVSSHQPDFPGKKSCPDANCVWHQTPGNCEMPCSSCSVVSQRTVISTGTHTLNKCIFQILLISGCCSLNNILRLVSVRLSRMGGMCGNHVPLCVASEAQASQSPTHFSSAGNLETPKGRKELKIWQDSNAEGFRPHSS